MIVLDSSLLVAYYNGRDSHHEAATVAMQAVAADEYGQALLPEHVFLEVVTVLMTRLHQDSASRIGRALLQSREIELVPCSDLFLQTFEAFADPATAGLSFTDAAIVTIARRYDPGYVATFDRGIAGVPGIVGIPEAF